MKVIVLHPAQDELNLAHDYYLHKASAHIAETFLTEFSKTTGLIFCNAPSENLSRRDCEHFP